MDNKLERILDKLRKLTDLKESAQQCGETGEANAAAAGIMRLLREYDLTLQDIPGEKRDTDPVGMEVVPYKISYMQYAWYWDLMDTVAHFNGATIIRTRNFVGKKVVDSRYQVIGRRQNRETVLYLVSFLAHQFTAIGRRKYPEWKLDYIRRTGLTPPVQGVYMKSFLSGCVTGLYEKLEQESRRLPQDRLTSLVKVERTAIEQYMQDLDVKYRRGGGESTIDSVREDGFNTGRNISIHKGVATTATKQHRIG